MWTTENCRRYDRHTLRYPSGLTGDEWSLVERLIPPAKCRANAALLHPLWNIQFNGIILARSNSRHARPYMARFSVFNRLI